MKITFVFLLAVASAMPSTGNALLLEIPEHCKDIGICEDVPNYPQEEADRIIAALPDRSYFVKDELDTDVLSQRVGPDQSNIQLCESQKRLVYPRAAVDFNGDWHAVLNSDKESDPLQAIKVEICTAEKAGCSSLIFTRNTYQTICEQKFIYREMAVVENGETTYKTLRVPSCCNCALKFIE